MKPTVYVETSVVSYYTARPSHNPIAREQQEITQQWWPHAARRFRLVVSEAVLLEVRVGDPQAAEKRLKAIKDFRILSVSEFCRAIANHYEKVLPLPKDAAADAMHLAIASVHGVDYLVTWNCTHLANALVRRALAETNSSMGLVTPIICTPEEMLEE